MKRNYELSEEELLERIAAEDELLAKVGATYGVGKRRPTKAIRPGPYESCTREELEQEMEQAKQKLKFLGEKRREREARAREYLRQQGITLPADAGINANVHCE